MRHAFRRTPMDAPPSNSTAPAVPMPAVSQEAIARAQYLYAQRRLRDRIFGEDLFGEPAWDLMLDVFISQALGKRVPVSSACIGGACAPTTGLRWIVNLERKGYLRRVPDPTDRRRSFVELEPYVMTAMEAYLRLKPEAAAEADQ